MGEGGLLGMETGEEGDEGITTAAADVDFFFGGAGRLFTRRPDALDLPLGLEDLETSLERWPDLVALRELELVWREPGLSRRKLGLGWRELP